MISGFYNIYKQNVTFEVYNELQQLENNFALDSNSIQNYKSKNIILEQKPIP